MRMTFWLLGALFVGACGGKDDSSVPAPVKMSVEARAKWDNVCVTCHGKTGHGDGPGAAATNPKPRSFSDKAWQASVTDEHLAKVIVEGGKAVGKSEQMAPNPDLAGKKDVVADLVKKVRSYGK